MFLKEISINGFKSFAEKTSLTFDENLTGIVGPNGCGKSNVADAIRWALGEQSSKSLRSSTDRSDMVFAGSRDYKPCEFASVSLTFDNSNRIFDIDYDEVEFTRRYHRSDGKTSYYINKKSCALKDITDLILDVGLGRDSLSIISQGNILQFAESKPEERRGLFEEASGVSKYRRRKQQSQNRLKNTQENLDRLSDLIAELESQIPELEKQAMEARKYQQLCERISLLEISLLCKEAILAKNEIDSLVRQENVMKEDEESLQKDIEQGEAFQKAQLETLSEKEKEQRTQRDLIDEQQDQLKEMELKKVQMEERRKYLMESQDPILQKQGAAQMAAEIQVRLSHTKDELADARSQYSRDTSTQKSIRDELKAANQDLSSTQQKAARLEARISYLESQSVNRPSSFSRIENMEGIIGLVGDLIHPANGYEIAIETALGAARNYVAAQKERDVKRAIETLKKTRSKRMSFMAKESINPRFLQARDKVYLSEPGVLGLASDFVSSSDDNQIYIDRLLANTIVSDNLDDALALYQKSRRNLRIVTLEGEQFSPGGIISGGSSKSSQDKQELLQAQKDLKALENHREELEEKVNGLEADSEKADQDVLDSSLSVQRLSSQLEDLNNQMDRIQKENELAEALQDMDKEQSFLDELMQMQESLKKNQQDYKEGQQKLSELRNQLERTSGQLRAYERKKNSLQQDKQELQVKKVKQETLLNAALNTLNQDHHLTFEAAVKRAIDVEVPKARREIQKLRLEREELGMVNQQAADQFSQIQERYSFLNGQHQELTQAKEQLEGAIEKMDETMTRQFLETFEKINKELNPIFQSMFKGGSARLILSDPKDPLHCGIEVEAHPPGKTMKGLQGYSGGEKALIAISVLFSIMRAKTVPLCVFDEVEAALDQANVDRFANYLSHFKEETQFLIITHRQGTMEQCDKLYGITMAGDGVSRALHVDLKEDPDGLV